jgi:hypothetical protein
MPEPLRMPDGTTFTVVESRPVQRIGETVLATIGRLLGFKTTA